GASTSTATAASLFVAPRCSNVRASGVAAVDPRWDKGMATPNVGTSPRRSQACYEASQSKRILISPLRSAKLTRADSAELARLPAGGKDKTNYARSAENTESAECRRDSRSRVS